MKALSRIVHVVLLPAIACACVPSAIYLPFPDPSDVPAISQLPDPFRALDGSTVAEPRTWYERRRPELKALFAHYVYGEAPGVEPVGVQREVLDGNAFNGLATLEEIRVTIGEDPSLPVSVLLALPKAHHEAAAHPVFLMQNKCGNHSVSEHPKIPVSSSWADPVACSGGGRERGKRADRYRIEDLLERGFAFATYHESDIDPDTDDVADGVRSRLVVDAEPKSRWGTLAAWAWGTQRIVDALEQIPQIDARRTALFGHSRRGKAALLAAAFDERVELVVVSQSGTGGATLSRSYAGESLAYINTRFPHWFNSNFKSFNGNETRLPVDQHELIALVAPRSVFLLYASDDTWADPQGGWRAAVAADPVWELLGDPGLDQPSQQEPNLQASLAFALRDGGHGVSPADWELFLRYASSRFRMSQ